MTDETRRAANAVLEAKLREQYASIDAAVADQRNFEGRSAVGELYAHLGQWGLHFAKSRADVEVLLAQKAPLDGLRAIEYGDNHQHWETPLLTAYIDGRTEVADALLAAGATLDAPNFVVDPQGKGFGHTVLHMVTSRGDHTAVMQLISAGADVDRQTTLGWTPLHFAAQKDNTQLVGLLLDAGARPDVEDFEGSTPFDEAGQATKQLIEHAAREHGLR